MTISRTATAGPVRDPELAAFAIDVHEYFADHVGPLPSRYLYDALGSMLFDAICLLPWYPLARAEKRLLRSHGRDVFSTLGSIDTLIELGPGNGDKLVTAIEAAGPRGSALDVHLIDVSPRALAQASCRLADWQDVRVVTHETTYEAGLAEIRLRPRRGRALAVFLGSNIGNFDPVESDTLLRTLRSSLTKDDGLLLGTDLVKPERELRLAYDDPLGVSAAFNRNVLVRMNRELDADFDINAFAHRADWNGTCARMEMRLVSLRPQRVRIPAADVDVMMAAGDSIWTENSYKYEPNQIVTMLEECGFLVIAQWVDPIDRFALTLARAA